MYLKGSRLLDQNGVWRCKNGHDKDVVGIYPSNGMCKACCRKWQNQRRKEIRRQRAGYRGDAMEIPLLAEVRKQLGLSQYRLAKLAGISRTTIWRIEAGEHRIGYTTRHKLLAIIVPALARQKRLYAR